MAKLRDILQHDITRDIEGVIKADDARRIQQEINEYVITQEGAKVLRKLFEGLQEAIDTQKRRGTEIYPFNGVWISGYFGSGKSHLLKILAYLLSAKAESELRTAFMEKIEDDAMLSGAVANAFAVPASSVLFNIDQQADAETDDRSQVVLFVFEKVFNRVRGFCDDDAIIADFERDLDEKGEYEAFKAHFEKETGSPWTVKRDGVATVDRPLFETAWASFRGVSSEEASAVLDRYDAHRTLTAELFAKRVKRWLDLQEDPNYRINFFADEVGQFVANHPDRMLNLQTIAETLATVCENRAWVFVTSQEDLDSVIGDANQEQRNDFSRITARFSFRLPLTSANVEEVIQKRLLAKTGEGRATLAGYFDRERDHLRATYRFGAAAKEIAVKSGEHFADSYPFLPYQFYYLQQALRGLSDHNAFMGRHVSRGERSMLEVFQVVGKELVESDVVTFATFDRMFHGVRNTLKSGILNQIDLAERELSDDLAVRLLKALLMLKYVKDLPTTAEHLTTLLSDGTETDAAAFRGRVQSALDALEYQSYVQRTGDLYEYLTDQEKDVEVEIKNTPVEFSEIRRLVGRVFFEKILKNNRLTYDDNGQEYVFSAYVDSELYKQGKSDLSFRVISHLNPNVDDRTALIADAMGKKELLIVMDVDSRTAEDLRIFYQTRTYLNQVSGAGDLQRDRILNDKRMQNAAREARLAGDSIPRLLEGAELLVADRPVDIGIRDPRQRLIAAFQELVKVSFPSLRMLNERYNEARLRTILLPDDGTALLSGDAVSIGEDESEMQAYLLRQQQAAKQANVAGIKEYFSRGQFGWYEWAILCVLAKLFARDAVELVEGTRILDSREAHTALSKGHGHERIVVRIAEPIDTDVVNAMTRFFQDFFHRAPGATSGKELIIELKETLIAESLELKQLSKEAATFPFLQVLSEVTKEYDEIAGLDYRTFAKRIRDDEEDLLFTKNDTVDAITGFMNGPGRASYERITLYLQGQHDNFVDLNLGTEFEALKAYLDNPRPWAGNATKQAQEVYSRATAVITNAIETKRGEAEAAISSAAERIRANETFGEINESERSAVLKPLETDLRTQIAATRSIASLENVVQIKAPKAVQDAHKAIASFVSDGAAVTYATPAEKRVQFDKTELGSAADVEAYADAVRKQYGKLVKAGKRIPV